VTRFHTLQAFIGECGTFISPPSPVDLLKRLNAVYIIVLLGHMEKQELKWKWKWKQKWEVKELLQ